MGDVLRTAEGPGSPAFACQAGCGYHNDMEGYVFVFQSERDPSARGYTTDLRGANLPPDLAPWRFVRGGAASIVSAGLSDVSLGDELLRRGFYVTHAWRDI
jgi:hypothetical protein